MKERECAIWRKKNKTKTKTMGMNERPLSPLLQRATCGAAHQPPRARAKRLVRVRAHDVVDPFELRLRERYGLVIRRIGKHIVVVRKEFTRGLLACGRRMLRGGATKARGRERRGGKAVGEGRPEVRVRGVK